METRIFSKQILIIITGLVVVLVMIIVRLPAEAAQIGDFGTNKLESKMIFVPTGKFSMGIDMEIALDACRSRIAEKKWEGQCETFNFEEQTPANTVNVASFWIDQHEVTYGEYKKCVSEGVCQSISKEYIPGDAYPVEIGQYSLAERFCAWSGTRLPTQEEWEYAARSPNSFLYPWGNDFKLGSTNVCTGDTCNACLTPAAWGTDCTHTAPVEQFPIDRSWVGAYDMLGNVGEFVQGSFKPYNGYTYDPKQSVWFSGEQSYPNTIKGAGYNIDQFRASLTYRQGVIPPEKGVTIGAGFRCARNDVATPNSSPSETISTPKK